MTLYRGLIVSGLSMYANVITFEVALQHRNFPSEESIYQFKLHGPESLYLSPSHADSIQEGRCSTTPEQRCTFTIIPIHPPANPSQSIYSHRPSFHPVLHLSSQNRQSNSFFPNFRFTSLCASQSHHPKSARPPSRG